MIVLVPSRGRPDNIRRLRQAWADTRAEADLMVLVDDDDPTLPDYGADVVVGPRRRIGPLLNDVALSVLDLYDVVGFMGDDHCPRTERWDAEILRHSTPWSVVYGNDLFQGQGLATAVFQGAELIRTMGRFNPPGCDHLYLDNYWMTLGDRLGTLTYLDHVVIEHMHYLVGKSVEDALYAEVNAPSMYEHDGRAWAEYAGHDMQLDLDRVKAAMSA
jgi:hypothetical protein